MIQDLSWFVDCVTKNAGVQFLESCSWEESEADLSLITDASGSGLAFWIPVLEVAFVAWIEEHDLCFGDIFFNEALAVISALEWAAHLPDHPRQLFI